MCKKSAKREKGVQKVLGSICIISFSMMLAKIRTRFQNYRQIWPAVLEILRIQFLLNLTQALRKLDSQYLHIGWSDLPEILESGPDFCKDHANRDDANQSEHFLHPFFTFCTFLAHFYFILARENQNLHFTKKFALGKILRFPKS